MGIDREKLKKIHEDAQKKGSNFPTKYWRAKVGLNIIRFCPPKSGSDVPVAMGKVHYGVDKEGKGMVVCRKTLSSKEHCPVCEIVSALYKSDNEVDKKLANKMRAKDSYSYNIIDRADEIPVVYIYQPPAGRTVESVNTRILGILSDYIDACDVDAGRDIVIERVGKDFTNTTYPTVGLYGEEVYKCSNKECKNTFKKTKGFEPEDKEWSTCKECGSRLILDTVAYPTSPLGVEKWEEELWDLEAEYVVPSVEEIQHVMSTTAEQRREEAKARKEAEKKASGASSQESDEDLDKKIKERLARLEENQTCKDF